MPTTTQEEAINSILESLNEIKEIKPQFIKQYLHFLETNKLFFQPYTSWTDTLRKSLGPTYRDLPPTKNTIEKLKLDTKKFLNISTSLDSTKNSGAQFQVENLINAIKNQMEITPLPLEITPLSPQTHPQLPNGQSMRQEECCVIL